MFKKIHIKYATSLFSGIRRIVVQFDFLKKKSIIFAKYVYISFPDHFVPGASSAPLATKWPQGMGKFSPVREGISCVVENSPWADSTLGILPPATKRALYVVENTITGTTRMICYEFFRLKGIFKFVIRYEQL